MEVGTKAGLLSLFKSRFLSSSLFLSVFALMGIGLVQVYSSSYILAIENYGDGLFFFKRQLAFTGLALLALIFATQIPLSILKNGAGPFGF